MISARDLKFKNKQKMMLINNMIKARKENKTKEEVNAQGLYECYKTWFKVTSPSRRKLEEHCSRRIGGCSQCAFMISNIVLNEKRGNINEF